MSIKKCTPVHQFAVAAQKNCHPPLKGGDSLTTIFLLRKVPNGPILKTLTSTDKLLGHICIMRDIFKVLESQPYLAGHMTGTEKA